MSGRKGDRHDEGTERHNPLNPHVWRAHTHLQVGPDSDTKCGDAGYWGELYSLGMKPGTDLRTRLAGLAVVLLLSAALSAQQAAQVKTRCPMGDQRLRLAQRSGADSRERAVPLRSLPVRRRRQPRGQSLIPPRISGKSVRERRSRARLPHGYGGQTGGAQRQTPEIEGVYSCAQVTV